MTLYFSIDYKQVRVEKYKWMTYPLAMHPRNRLRELRKKAGISQAELAERTGVSQPAISQIENDVTQMDVAWMRAFARELGCTAADLLAPEDNPDRLSEAERRLIAAYRAADDTQRAMVERVAEPIAPVKSDASERDPPKHRSAA